jgi:uncharacterized protein (TIGR02646 family)
MRRIEKLAAPDILRDNADNWTQELLAAAVGSDEFSNIQSRYRHREIREQLRRETSGKCAYCESLIGAVAYPHIEHMRPKHLHRELTFHWINLTLACPVCNVNKSNDDATEENFVNPYADNTEARFRFIAGFMTCQPDDLPARNMVNWLDLNRGDLVIQRTEVIERVQSIYLEAIALERGARRAFIRHSIARLTRAGSTYSRVAEDFAALCEANYSDALELD